MDGGIRLHLGCGEQYLNGYVNIDFPPSEHTVQQTSAADEFADITRLHYEPESVAEVRSHHVFEHFSRPTAMRLLIDWHEWLADGGLLTIETPDFKRSARMFLLGRRRGLLVRHMFGSHEAPWAVHWDGWYEERFRRTLTMLGYGPLRFRKSKQVGTYNITVSAERHGGRRNRYAQLEAAGEVLRDSLVDNTAGELRILAEWMKQMRATH